MSARIPFDELRIADDWLVVDLKTAEDCDEALIHLARDIAHIDSQIVEEAAEEHVTGVLTDPEWLSKAKSARAVKVVIRSVVQRRQGELSRAARAAAQMSRDRRLLAALKVAVPDVFAAAVSQMGDTTTTRDSIQLTPHEIQSGHDRVRWAEGLILQLPTAHEGRNSWLLNYGRTVEAKEHQEKRSLKWSDDFGAVL